MSDTSKEVILVVEDDEGVALLERRALERRGYAVVVTTGVEDSLAAVRGRAFDLIVTDYRLATGTGLELLKRLQATSRNNPPAILVTGYSDEVTMIEAIRCGVRDFIPKTTEYLQYLPNAVERVLKSVRTERELAASHAMYESLARISPVAIILSNAAGDCIDANDRWCEMAGLSAAQALGDGWLAAVHPEDRDRVVQDWSKTRRDGEPFRSEYRLRRPAGDIVWVISEGVSIRDVTGVITGFIRVSMDLTEEKRMEQTLEQRVRDRTTELTVINEELIQASQFKSEFLATMSHELRTPLNGVLGMNELLLKTQLTDKQREFIEASSSSGRALLSLISDILDISKIEAGKIELDVRSYELEALVYDVITMFSYRAKQTGVALVCRLDPETCVTAMCDDNRLRQVLVNLLGNALKFTTTGSVILESKCVQLDDRRIVVRLTVTDTGLGIPEDKVDRLFSPFSQVNRSTSRQYGGTGLGLAITKQLVELMGGTVGVKSRLGVGSTFWIEVPFELVNAEIKTTQRRQLLEGTKVLAVDGVDKERRQIADCLEAWGCPYHHVGTLREALAAVSQAEREGYPFAAILADCRLAIGDEFVHLRKLTRRPDLPVIGLGIGEGNDLANHLRQLGLRHLLRDPVRPSALFNAMTSVLAVTTPTAAENQKLDDAAGEQTTTFSGHVLVAEDNRINQMYIVELLKHCGCTCDVTNNGDEALTALQEKSYALVLMDCQMPEMDGFTASREIRRRETVDGQSRRIPIVALTANALKGDRDRCLDAGMDDYLSKPLQTTQLQAVLAKYLGQSVQE